MSRIKVGTLLWSVLGPAATAAVQSSVLPKSSSVPLHHSSTLIPCLERSLSAHATKLPTSPCSWTIQGLPSTHGSSISDAYSLGSLIPPCHPYGMVVEKACSCNSLGEGPNGAPVYLSCFSPVTFRRLLALADCHRDTVSPALPCQAGVH